MISRFTLIDTIDEETNVVIKFFGSETFKLLHDEKFVATLSAKDLITVAKAIDAILKEQEPHTLSDNRVKIGNHYAHNVDHIIMSGC